MYEETQIERKTIPQSVYKTFRNDVSMLIDGRLIVFVEHQSTLNENMPLRFLEYFVHILYGMVPARARYRRSLVKIPSPEFYVFYNGSETSPSEDELRLSDAFLVPQEEPFCELRVRFENISGKEGGSVKGKLPIRENCGILREYCQFMELVFRRKNCTGYRIASGRHRSSCKRTCLDFQPGVHFSFSLLCKISSVCYT